MIRILILFLLAVPTAMAQTTFHGDTARTGVYPTAGPQQLNGTKWTFKTDGPIIGSPAIAEGVVYIGSTDGNVYAVEQETGKQKWKFKTFAARQVTSSPTIANGLVYFGGFDGILYAVDTQTGFVARPDGEISGRVGDDSGIVAEDVYPEIFFADGKVSETSFRQERLTDAKTFKFSFLPPGRYYLGFNLRGGPSIDSPYPEFYYPGVEDRSKATLITVGEGQKISDLYLRRPLRLAERMIEGSAVWPDGKPYVENCGISLDNPRTGYREGNCVSTDAEGRFKIKAIEGQTYHLVASISGPKGGLISSKPVVVKVKKDNSPVKLVVESP